MSTFMKKENKGQDGLSGASAKARKTDNEGDKREESPLLHEKPPSDSTRQVNETKTKTANASPPDRSPSGAAEAATNHKQGEARASNSKPGAFETLSRGQIEPTANATIADDQGKADIRQTNQGVKATAPRHDLMISQPEQTQNARKRKKTVKLGSTPDHPLDPLSTMTKTFLATQGIETPEGFLSKRTKEIAMAFIKWREQKGMSILKGHGAVASVSGWKTTIRAAAQPPSDEEMDSDPDTNDGQSMPSSNQLPGGERGKPATKKRRLPTQLKVQENPFACLSAMTRSFLSNLAVTTPEQFLAARTSDLANSFISWRQTKGLNVLKGHGAVASVSSWKAAMRKALEHNQNHQEDTSRSPRGGAPSVSTTSRTIAPGGNQSRGKDSFAASPHPLTAEHRKHRWKLALSELMTSDSMRYDSVGHLFSVWNHHDTSIKHEFELSLRRSMHGTSWFLTYCGSKVDTAVERGDRKSTARTMFIVKEALKEDISAQALPILEYVEYVDSSNTSSARGVEIPGNNTVEHESPALKNHLKHLGSAEEKAKPHEMIAPKHEESRSPFSSVMEGGGLINLSRSGIFPIPFKGETDRLIPQIESFICDPKELPSDSMLLRQPKLQDDVKCNEQHRVGASRVIVNREQSGKLQYLLFVPRLLERGQTMELSFETWDTKQEQTNVSDVHRARLLICQSLARLSLPGIRRILILLQKKAQLIDKMLKRMVDNEVDDTHHVYWLVAFRRVQWLAKTIRDCLQRGDVFRPWGNILPSSRATTEERRAGEFDLRRFDSFSKLRRMQIRPLQMYETLRQEIREEILASAELDGLKNSSCRKSWCKLARDLFDDVAEHLSICMADQYAPLRQMQGLIDLVSRAAAAIKLANTSALKQLSFTIVEGQVSPICSSVVDRGLLQTMRLPQAYADTMALCSETAYPISSVDTLVVEPQNSSSSKHHGLTLLPLEYVRAQKAQPHFLWYVENQIVEVVRIVTLCGVEFTEMYVQEVMMGSVENWTSVGILNNNVFRKTKVLEMSNQAESCVFQPTTFPLFLGLVWPTLRKRGWNIGETSGAVCFTPFAQQKKSLSLDKQARDRRRTLANTRAKLAQMTTEIGMGDIPKLAKRLLILCAKEREGLEESEAKSSSVDDVFNAFSLHLKEGISNNSTVLLERVLKELKRCYDAVAPALLYESEVTGQAKTDEWGCEHLVRFILVYSSILRQSEFSLRQVRYIAAVITELLHFIASKYVDLLQGKFHPPVELYQSETKFPSKFMSVLEISQGKKSGKSLPDSTEQASGEAVLPGDKANLTDYVYNVMTQAICCHATVEDVAKKGRKIQVGFPGVCCRHCLGTEGEGKYFFASLESLTTAANVLEKHYIKCSKFPSEERTKMLASKGHHAEQRKRMPYGSQTAYFTRFWQRLQSSKPDHRSPAPAVFVVEAKEEEAKEEIKKAPEREYFNHVLLLDHLTKPELLKGDAELLSALDEYYRCLEYGGRIYKTEKMPIRFSAEWVLAKATSTWKKGDELSV